MTLFNPGHKPPHVRMAALISLLSHMTCVVGQAFKKQSEVFPFLKSKQNLAEPLHFL